MKKNRIYACLFSLLLIALSSLNSTAQNSNVLFHVTAGFPEAIGPGFTVMTGDARLSIMASGADGMAAISGQVAYHFAGKPGKGPQKPFFISQHLTLRTRYLDNKPSDSEKFSGFRFGYEYFPISRLGFQLSGGFSVPISEVAQYGEFDIWPSASFSTAFRF